MTSITSSFVLRALEIEVVQEYLNAQALAASEIWADLRRPLAPPRVELCDCGRPWLEDHLCSNLGRRYPNE